MDRAKQADLVLRLREHGDQEAANELFTYLLDKRSSRVKIIGTALGLSHEDVDDLVQKTLVMALQKFMSPNFNVHGPASISTFYVSLALRIAMNMRTKSRKWPLDLSLLKTSDLRIEDFLLPVETHRGEPLEAMMDQETQELLKDAILELPHENSKSIRNVFCLRLGYRIYKGRLIFVKEMKLPQIARKLGMNRTMAHRKYTRAKIILTKRLSKILDAPSPTSSK